jgi:hypothetical protein
MIDNRINQIHIFSFVVLKSLKLFPSLPHAPKIIAMKNTPVKIGIFCISGLMGMGFCFLGWEDKMIK